MLQLRVTSPPDLTEPVLELIDACLGVANVAVVRGSSVRPPGDLIIADVARESVEELLTALRELGVDEVGAISLLQIDTSVSRAAELAEEKAPGAGADAVIWEEVVRRTDEDARLSHSFVIFLTVATILAAIAVITDSAILVVGAMVVGPEFGPLAAISVGLVNRRFNLIRSAAFTLALGYVTAVAITTLLSLLANAVGWVPETVLTEPRPLTGFIWHPDKWSFIVAFIAGVAGTLSLTSAKSTALTGVFISVTTVPAAGNFALALALGDRAEMAGSAAQLGINTVAILIAGVLTLAIQILLGGGNVLQRATGAARPT